MTFPQFVFRNIVRNKRTYGAYFFSSSFSIMVFFVYTLFIFHPDIDEKVTNPVALLLMVAAEVIIYFFSFFFVLYSVSSFLKTRKREFGVLMLHGMTRKQLYVMVFLENMLNGIASIILGVGLGIILGKLFLMVGSRMIDIEALTFHLSPISLWLTALAFLTLFICISFFTLFLVRTNNLNELFQAGKKPKKEPRVSTFLSILSAILLVASYYLAVMTTMQTLLIRIIPVIGMTIVGTYFFYTQLSVFLVKMLKKNRGLLFNKTNLITFSNLAYRLKDNANLFFIVTIVSTVSFCGVGTLASMNVLNKQFKAEYPAVISYIQQDANDSYHQQNLEKIKTELSNKEIIFRTHQVPIKYVEIVSSTDQYAPSSMPLISFSNYKKITKYAGFDFNEIPLTGNKVFGMKTHLLENDDNVETYTVGKNKVILTRSNYTKHVVMPKELLLNEGVVVSDSLFESLVPSKKEEFVGFFTTDLQKTAYMFNDLVNEGVVWHNEDKPYAMTVSGTLYENRMNLFSMMLFVALMVGAVFFIAAGSFLYFRLYADLDYDSRHFLTLTKVGLTDQELKKIITQQLLILFFIPLLMAVIHSIFAFAALQSYFTLSISSEMLKVLMFFVIAQIIYFLIIRQRYMVKLKRRLF